MERKIKVVWITNFSNAQIRKHMPYHMNPVEAFVRKITHRPAPELELDFCMWITNGIEELKAYEDIELHVISSRSHIQSSLVEFEEDGIYYHFIENEEDRFHIHLAKNLFPWYQCQYKRNSKWINQIIDRINPDVIHLIGPENPSFSRAFVECKRDTPTIVMLQTLMSEPGFCDNYPIKPSHYKFRCYYEQQSFLRADYIGTDSDRRRDFIRTNIKPNGVFLNHRLPMGMSNFPDSKNVKKKFDFVYYGGLSKAFDYAIEEFALAKKKHPEITLDVIGGYNPTQRKEFDERLQELGILDSVTYEGMLPRHDDVLERIQYARFALLPLKVDYISTTILEGMALGLPVVTTITKGTPTLNEERKSVLLSPIGDHQALADNMCRLLEDETFAERIRQNALLTVNTAFNNQLNIQKWVDTYRAIVKKEPFF